MLVSLSMIFFSFMASAFLKMYSLRHRSDWMRNLQDHFGVTVGTTPGIVQGQQQQYEYYSDIHHFL